MPFVENHFCYTFFKEEKKEQSKNISLFSHRGNTALLSHLLFFTLTPLLPHSPPIGRQ